MTTAVASSGIVTPGRLYLVDTSALARARQPRVARVLAGLIADRAAATCATVDLEAGYSGRGHADVLAIDRYRREAYVRLPLDEIAAERAREIQILMAGAGLHRAAGVVDLLTAAVAERHDAAVLHYDADFEHIGTVTGQAHVWVADRGSLD
jgi:hypothetical protein